MVQEVPQRSTSGKRIPECIPATAAVYFLSHLTVGSPVPDYYVNMMLGVLIRT
jgi:hypothetical protein